MKKIVKIFARNFVHVWIARPHFWIILFINFCSSVSKHGTHLAHSFLMSKFSVDIRRTALFEMPTMSATSHSFSPRSSNTILWIFFTIPVVATSFGWPLRCSFWQLVRTRPSSATQYFIAVNKGTDSPRVNSSSVLISVGLRPFNLKYYITQRWLLFSTFTYSLRAFTIDGCKVIFSNNNRHLYVRSDTSGTTLVYWFLHCAFKHFLILRWEL